MTRYREEPVYDDRCYYTVDRWGYARSVITSGEGLAQAPFWGSAGISRFSGVGAERESGRSETYLLILRAEDGTEYRCPVEAERWQSAASQSRWSLPVNVVTRQPDCAALAPAG